MKTKHKLKLLSELPKGFQEYEDLRRSLFLEAMGNITEISKAETKSQPIIETFKVGDKVRVIDTSNHCFVMGKEVTVKNEAHLLYGLIHCIDSFGLEQALHYYQIEHI